MPDQLKLRTVTGNTTLSNSEVDTNFSSLFYSASMSGSFLVFSTTGSNTKTVTRTPINLGLGNHQEDGHMHKETKHYHQDLIHTLKEHLQEHQEKHLMQKDTKQHHQDNTLMQKDTKQ